MRYTRRSVTSPTWDQEISGFWKHYTTNTAEFEGEHHMRCQSGYIEDFESFFGSLPAVMTTHVSDITAQTVHSLLQRLASSRLKPFPPLPFEGLQNTAPTFACTQGVHGSSYGQGASVNPKNRTFACGPPYITLPKTATTLFKIVTALRKAKKNGCIALLTEIVCWDNGVRVTPNNWSLLIQACADVGLPMIADETLSAIRCGAPWAYQRPEYVTYGPPDLVIFGKGMETAGLAINPNGKFFTKYHLDADEVTSTGLFQTRASFSVWCHPAVLLRSWMVIRAAKEEKWPERSTQIGGILRTFAKDTITKRKHKSELLGLEALIYIRTESAKMTATQGAAGAPGWLRWLPTMDDVMADPERLKIQMFGPTSLAHRKLLVKIMEDIGDLPPWCSSCGDFQIGEAFCSICCAATCDICVSRGNLHGCHGNQ
jgi:adenosylmethionine-8-amino-7-oxononanoate aminotransferase